MDMPIVQLDTSAGSIQIELYANKAPQTVANFLDYVQSGHYDGTIFHRVIDGFMIQGGGFDATMNEKKTGTPIKNEANNGLGNEVGTIAMARTSDPHSATSQFFINVNNNSFLNYTAPNTQGYGYAVFGKVIDGMDVVNAIKGVPTGKYGFHGDVPKTPIVIESAKIINQ